SNDEPATEIRPSDRDELWKFIHIDSRRTSRVQKQLTAVFDGRINVRRVERREILQIELPKQPDKPLEVEFDNVRSGVLISGPSAAVLQMASMIESLADDDSSQGQKTQVFHVRRDNHRSVEKILNPRSAPVRQVPHSESIPSEDSANEHSARYRRRKVSPVDFVQADDSDTETGRDDDLNSRQVGNSESNHLDENSGSESEDAPLRQFEGVDMKSLPELDVIILRGRDQDLNQLESIIRQLEKISQDTQAEVKVVSLRHAQSEGVAEIVTKSNEDLNSGRSGKATVTPLAKPNSLLVIGWGEALNATLRLIEELDQPVAPQTQATVFRLRYASASVVQKTITAFFANRKGMGSKVQATVDVRTNSVIVHASPNDLLEVKRMVQELDRSDSGAVNEAKIFTLKNALAADVATTLLQAIKAAAGTADHSAILELQTFDAEGQRILRSGTLEHIQITPNVRNNSLIVSCPKVNLELIGELIRQLDFPSMQAKIKVFEIINGDAASLTQTLRSLLPSQTAANVGPQLSSDPNESNLVPLRFSVDVRSNSIIATGSEGELRIVEALLIKLDQNNSAQRKSTVFQLKNAPVLDVASAVNQFLVSRRRVEQVSPGSENPFQELEREVVVVPEPVSNKLLLAATPRYFEEISRLIEKLDEQPPQVMIQVLIAEVALNNTDEFGVELGLQDSVLFDRSLLGSIFTTTETTTTSTPAGVVTATQQVIQAATNAPGFGFNSIQPLGNSGSNKSLSTSGDVGGQGISNFSVGRGNDQLGFGGLVLSASSQNVSVLLRALQESRRVDILSRPQIRTLDNQPAFIQVGQRVPRIVGSTINQIGQQNSVTLENVGLILGVTPRISPDGNVVMEIDAEKSSLGDEKDGIPISVSNSGSVVRSPRIEVTSAQATVSAADGETIVLGGLITEGTQQFHRQIPWLGDIPILG
ncbi:MAG: hypothetical protein FJ267_03280, partial [Planctomycetes bacterium]|nr:hypothetical protein [Planctomycetota bacterium]